MSLLDTMMNSGSGWTGGSQKRVSPPSGDLGSGIPGANTRVGSPADGVSPSEMKRARFNSGSNIRVPYARVVPVSENKLPTASPSNGVNRKDSVTETEDLRPLELAFIRGAGIEETAASHDKLGNDRLNNFALTDGDKTDYDQLRYKGLNPVMMRIGKGVDRPQRLCSFEYAKRFFEICLGNAKCPLPAGFRLDEQAFLRMADTAEDTQLAKLHKNMRGAGIFLWTPDGVLVGKDHTGSEPDWENIFDTKHGQLFNVAVQGPAVLSTFTGERRLVTMPGERLFVLVTCDISTQSSKCAAPKDLKKKKCHLETHNTVEKAEVTEPNSNGDKYEMHDFQLRLSTASEMWSTSGTKSRNPRMGLSFSGHGNEGRRTYVVGGWSIGRVLDSAASRPYTGMYQKKQDCTSHAVNINVCIEWKSCHDLFATYCDKDNSISARGNPKSSSRLDVKK